MLFLIPFLLWAPLSWSTAVYRQVWECQLFAEIVGNGNYYAVYGRDSWKGEGFISCESKKQTQKLPVTISFNSLFDGFGADGNSSLLLVASMTTEQDPSRLKLIGTVADNGSDNYVRWSIKTDLNRADFFIFNANIPAVTRSLQFGRLFIRPAGDSK